MRVDLSGLFAAYLITSNQPSDVFITEKGFKSVDWMCLSLRRVSCLLIG